MSNKSYMPDGGYTLTQGSNYMMDGFHFDTEYGGGPQEKARLPEAKGLADLPSGMIPLDSEGSSLLPDGIETEIDLNMGEITREANQDINLIDHSWLASQPEPNLSGQIELEELYKDLEEGHMNNDTHNKIKELQDSWGQTSTTGLEIIPNENRSHDKYHNSYRDDQSKLPGDDYRQKMEDDYRQMMEKNIRKLAYGLPIKNVLSNIEDKHILDVKAKLASEYGLHGRVYIKEEHFPGLFNGKWDEVINKRCATSMYIIPKGKDCAFDRFLGMEVVNEIPWKKAAKALLPKLESYGVRIASGSAKVRLQNAFIDLIEGRVERQEKSATWFPTQLDQSSLISLDHARRELESAREENIFVASMEEVEQSKIERRLQRIAQELVSQKFLDSEQVGAVVELKNKTASEKIKRLYELASKPLKSASYSGQGKDASYHSMRKNHTDANAFVPKKENRELKKRQKSALQKISKLVSSGFISVEKVQEIAKGKTPEEKVASVFEYLANPEVTKDYEGVISTAHIITSKNKLPTEKVKDTKVDEGRRIASNVEQYISNGILNQEDVNQALALSGDAKFKELYKLAVNGVSAKKSEFKGQKFEAHISKRASNPTKTAHEAQSDKISTWLRQKISEGSAGEELDLLMATRFSQSVLKTHEERIASVRVEHEGLSGHVYVDASSYMTKGTDGCDKGALVHRANQIPTLLKTSKCGSCVFNSGGVCQKYNKTIVASVSEVVENPTSYQQEMIRLANASDSEQTASLFVNNYDANEFNLTANQEVSVDDSPEPEELGNVLFGGFEV